MKAVMDAAVTHWRALGNGANARVETSETAVVALVEADERLANAQRAPLSRIARAIGKANGYHGTLVIDKLKQPVG
jgi:hypothetical protein